MDQVQQIKQKLDIVDVIGHYVQLKKRGRHHLGLCPFHQEKTPSFTVSPELQIFKCFGCGKAGDIFTFIQEYDGISFPEALEILAQLAGITLEKKQFFTKKDVTKKRLLAINQLVNNFYHYILTKHALGKKALKYVQGRGIKPDTIDLFKIGYCPNNPKLLINFLSKKGFTSQELIGTGTFGTSQYNGRLYDRFRDRLTFPLTNYRGQVLGFSGRVLPGSKPDLAKYINSPETDLYHKSQTLFAIHLTRDAIKKANCAIVTEGEFDLISPFQAGFTNIVAIKGTAFTPDQLQLLRRYADTLILALDSDFAGSSAARKSIQLADQLDFDIQVLSLGDRYKDPDEAIQSDPDFFAHQIKNTLSIWDFIITSTLKTNDPGTPKGKKQALNIILPFLSKINNAVIRSDYIQKLANLIGSDPDAIYQEIQKINQKPGTNFSKLTPDKPDSNQSQKDVPLTGIEKLEQRLLVLVFSAKKSAILASRLKDKLPPLSTPRFDRIFTALTKTKSYQPKKFQAKLPVELQPTYQSLYLEASSQAFDSVTRKRQLKKTISQLSQLYYQKKLKNLNLQISRAESQKDLKSVKKLEKEYNQVLSKLSAIK